MIVAVSVYNDTGWHRVVGEVPDGSDQECYALLPKACRIEFWRGIMRQPIPNGRVIVWEVM